MKDTFVSFAVALAVFMFGCACTAGAALAGAQGIGADDSLNQQVSVRGGSARSGRVLLGGGLHGGK